ncbi:hypothetical protein IT412_05660 [Candidatus Peregrinibacteria bacterium]|nr:hypothetical protein [Candidatus Peregrinibacteria bacterium]
MKQNEIKQFIKTQTKLNKSISKTLVVMNEGHKYTQETLVSMAKSHKLTGDIFQHTHELLQLLVNVNKFIFFIIGLLFYSVYFSATFNKLAASLINNWGLLPEAWQIFILGAAVSLPIAIIAQIIASLIMKKIEQIIR